MKRRHWLMAVGWLMALPAWAGAPGSWVGDARAVRVFTPGRLVDSRAIEPPAAVRGEIASVAWRFEVPPGVVGLRAWLCHPQRCLALSAARGRSKGLAGLAADAPLRFRFGLVRGHQPTRPLRITGLQAIVDYR
ncbi:flagellar protein FlhE [Modicisalibacter coralii]|uniref:flagellar protein FlhE n=1 Tax=Modicisalibacter coralii TaxID=2304602 RepID=UPI00100BADA9|nr:flagellar protein FlhE [Halomonas coralii]